MTKNLLFNFSFLPNAGSKKKMSSRYTTVTKHQLSKSSIQVGLGEVGCRLTNSSIGSELSTLQYANCLLSMQLILGSPGSLGKKPGNPNLQEML